MAVGQSWPLAPTMRTVSTPDASNRWAIVCTEACTAVGSSAGASMIPTSTASMPSSSSTGRTAVSIASWSRWAA